jgi:hypothetical protein
MVETSGITGPELNRQFPVVVGDVTVTLNATAVADVGTRQLPTPGRFARAEGMGPLEGPGWRCRPGGRGTVK